MQVMQLLTTVGKQQNCTLILGCYEAILPQVYITVHECIYIMLIYTILTPKSARSGCEKLQDTQSTSLPVA